jgi:hypothetical protein
MERHIWDNTRATNEASAFVSQTAGCASSLSKEDIHSVKAGSEDVTYIGPAWLLPEHLRARCACAGLFFARVVSYRNDDIELEVAALAHYFDADDISYKRHVCLMTISPVQFALLLEWDRHLATLATCDVREIVIEHTMAVRREQATHAGTGCVTIDLGVTLPEGTEKEKEMGAEQQAQRQAEQSVEGARAFAAEEREEVDLVPLKPSVFVPRYVVQEVFHRLQITRRRDRRVHTAILVAVLDVLEAQMDQSYGWQEHRELEEQYEQIRFVRQWRRQQRDRGYGWQRVVALEESWKHGQAGWEVIVGMPVAA